MDQWLIRTVKNRISGPFPAAKIREKIDRGELGSDDEICQANGYWIYVRDREEIQKKLNGELLPVEDRDRTNPELSFSNSDSSNQEREKAQKPEFQKQLHATESESWKLIVFILTAIGLFFLMAIVRRLRYR